jgi:hypothetical protein
MASPNAARAAPASASGDPQIEQAGRRLNSQNTKADAHAQSLPASLRETFAAAAREYRGEPPLAKPDPGLLRAMFLDAIGDVPSESLAAFVAVDMGDDAEARARMSRVVLAVKEAARLFNQLSERMR